MNEPEWRNWQTLGALSFEGASGNLSFRAGFKSCLRHYASKGLRRIGVTPFCLGRIESSAILLHHDWQWRLGWHGVPAMAIHGLAPEEGQILVLPVSTGRAVASRSPLGRGDLPRRPRPRATKPAGEIVASSGSKQRHAQAPRRHGGSPRSSSTTASLRPRGVSPGEGFVEVEALGILRDRFIEARRSGREANTQ